MLFHTHGPVYSATTWRAIKAVLSHGQCVGPGIERQVWSIYKEFLSIRKKKMDDAIEEREKTWTGISWKKTSKWPITLKGAQLHQSSKKSKSKSKGSNNIHSPGGKYKSKIENTRYYEALRHMGCSCTAERSPLENAIFSTAAGSMLYDLSIPLLGIEPTESCGHMFMERHIQRA